MNTLYNLSPEQFSVLKSLSNVESLPLPSYICTYILTALSSLYFLYEYPLSHAL